MQIHSGTKANATKFVTSGVDGRVVIWDIKVIQCTHYVLFCVSYVLRTVICNEITSLQSRFREVFYIDVIIEEPTKLDNSGCNFSLILEEWFHKFLIIIRSHCPIPALSPYCLMAKFTQSLEFFKSVDICKLVFLEKVFKIEN